MIKFYTGVMKSGKSLLLIEEIEKCKKNYLIIKPSVDTRDGAFVATRAHERKHSAVLIDETSEPIVNMFFNSILHYDVIFIDEVQFFSKEFIDNLLFHAQMLNIDIIASGLLKDFRLDYFPASQMIMKYKPHASYLMGVCYHCNETLASIDILMDADDNIITEGDSIQVEGENDDRHYESLCVDCFDDMVYGIEEIEEIEEIEDDWEEEE